MTLIHTIFICILLLLIGSVSAPAQQNSDFEEWKKNELEKQKAFKTDQEKGIQNLKELYQQYIEDEEEQLKIYRSIGRIPDHIKKEIEKVEKLFPKEITNIPLSAIEAELKKIQEKVIVIEPKPVDLTEFKSDAETKSVAESKPGKQASKDEITTELNVNRPVTSPINKGLYRISSVFNKKRMHPILKIVRPHNGIDMAAKSGTKVFAAANGRVVLSKYSKTAGHYIVVDHKNGYTTAYMHLKNRNVKIGDIVDRGQLIGSVGSTGLSTGPHLHYEIRKNGSPYDPLDYIITYFN